MGVKMNRNSNRSGPEIDQTFQNIQQSILYSMIEVTKLKKTNFDQKQKQT